MENAQFPVSEVKSKFLLLARAQMWARSDMLELGWVVFTSVHIHCIIHLSARVRLESGWFILIKLAMHLSCRIISEFIASSYFAFVSCIKSRQSILETFEYLSSCDINICHIFTLLNSYRRLTLIFVTFSPRIYSLRGYVTQFWENFVSLKNQAT